MIGLLLVFVAVAVAIHLAGMIIVALALRLPMSEINLFLGPALLERSIRGIPVVIRPLPLGASIRISKDRKDDSPAYRDQHPLRWSVAIMSGHLALLAAAASFLGIYGASAELLAGFKEIVLGALSPKTAGADYVGAIVTAFDTLPLTALFGITCVKTMAFNLLPIPVLNGGNLTIGNLLVLLRTKSRIRERFYTFGCIIVVGIAILWGAAVYHWVSRPDVAHTEFHEVQAAAGISAVENSRVRYSYR